MFASAMDTAGIHRNTWPIWTGVILASVFTLANSDGRLEISPVYESHQTEAIFDSAGDWRKPPMFESEWRAPRTQKEGRIKFGYDSAHEQMHAHQEELFSPNPLDINEPKPSSQFRINF